MPEFPFEPRVVGWELTLRCNMTCLHCGSSAGSARPGELSEDEGLSLIDQLLELGMEVITLSGGEPLLHPAWHRYAKKLVDAGVSTYMITNGLLLERCIPRLVEVGLKRIGLSLDGTAPTHDRIRDRVGSFDTAVTGAAAAARAGIAVGAVTHVSRLNLPELEAMYAIFASIPLAFWQIQITFRQGRMKAHDDLSLAPGELVQILDFIHGKQGKQGKQGEPGLKVVAGDNLGYYSTPPLRDRPWKGCFAGRHLVGIDADGAVKGCLSLPREFVEGNIRQESLRTIWEDPQRFRYNRYFSPDMLSGHCRDCQKALSCRAGCVVTAHSATGDRFDNPYCLYRVQREAHGALRGE